VIRRHAARQTLERHADLGMMVVQLAQHGR
jgi:hypothetical protein